MAVPKYICPWYVSLVTNCTKHDAFPRNLVSFRRYKTVTYHFNKTIKKINKKNHKSKYIIVKNNNNK